MIVLVTVMLLLGSLYSAGPRPQKANVTGFVLVVTSGGAVTYLVGWATVGGEGLPPVRLLVVGTAMSLWMGLVGMTKDLSDAAGDRVAGRRTLPIQLGPRRASGLLAVFAFAVGITSFLAYRWAGVDHSTGMVHLVGSGVVAGCLLVAVAQSGVNADAVPRRTRARRPYRAFMITDLAAHGTLLLGLIRE